MKKQLQAVIALAISILFTLSPTIVFAKEDQDFDAWLHQEFISYMEDDYMSMHYTMEDYKKAGIKKPEVSLGNPSLEDTAETLKDLEDSLKELKSFSYDSLTDVQKHDYDTYLFYLENTIELSKYPMLDEWFSPSEGVQTSLITNFTEFTFYRQEDVDDYLKLLQDVPRFLDGALKITKMQAEKGFFLTDSQLNDTTKNIEEFTSNKTKNPLIIIFHENVEKLEGLTKEQIQKYEQENDKLVLETVIPSFENVSKELEKLRGSRKFKGGYCNYEEGGKQYYEALAKRKGSTNLSVQEQFDLCNEFLQDTIFRIATEFSKNNDIGDQMDQMSVDLDSPDKVLAYLKDHMQDYPEGPDVQYIYSYLDPSIANPSVVAYYLQPPVDQILDNVIRINKDNIKDSNSLYETLAHEGFPGHLYQITWYLNTKPNLIRSYIGNIGYAEGWAMYAEVHSWQTSPLPEDVSKMHAYTTTMGYLLDATVDLAVNGLGYEKKDVGKWLDKIGLGYVNVDTVYQNALDHPGLLLPYGEGLMQFLRLQEMAKDSLQKEFDQKAFNKVLLTYGDRPFYIVEKDVKNWIENNGKEVIEPKPVTITDSNTDSFFDTDPGIFILFGIVVVVVVIARKAQRRYRKDDPFES